MVGSRGQFFITVGDKYVKYCSYNILSYYLIIYTFDASFFKFLQLNHKQYLTKVLT